MSPSEKRPADRAGLFFRQDYFDDPAGWSAIKTLLIDIFNVDITALDGLGGHDRTSFPSAYFDGDGRCIANLSAFSMPLMIDGRAIKAAGWQSGAVRPEYRGRGLYQDLIRITLDRCEEQDLEAIVLYTDKPGLYAPHGFRILPQYSFKGPVPAISGTPPSGPPARYKHGSRSAAKAAHRPHAGFQPLCRCRPAADVPAELPSDRRYLAFPARRWRSRRRVADDG
nr:GNAT family N-acetyltransferase [Rhizobium sp. ACO-34A]